MTAYDDSTIVSVPLPAAPAGKLWRILNPDGTLGTTLSTTVALRRAEGVVLIATADVFAQASDGSPLLWSDATFTVFSA